MCVRVHIRMFKCVFAACFMCVFTFACFMCVFTFANLLGFQTARIAIVSSHIHIPS